MKETVECLVVNVNQDMAKVRVKMHSDCSSCGLCEGGNAVYYEAYNNVGAKCGKSVILEVEKDSILKTAFIIFVLPLLVIAVSSVFGVYLAGYVHAPNLPAALVVNMITLVPLFGYIKRYDAKIQGKSKLPVITKVIN